MKFNAANLMLAFFFLFVFMRATLNEDVYQVRQLQWVKKQAEIKTHFINMQLAAIKIKKEKP